MAPQNPTSEDIEVPEAEGLLRESIHCWKYSYYCSLLIFFSVKLLQSVIIVTQLLKLASNYYAAVKFLEYEASKIQLYLTILSGATQLAGFAGFKPISNMTLPLPISILLLGIQSYCQYFIDY
eukprot:GHVP01070893.1.p1 GENE.GHVP01070893.1~~GHVP01070893.1.p1  ORF type:complete len:123 (-),score=16.76 GHVP01070893.1:368-736(-)